MGTWDRKSGFWHVKKTKIKLAQRITSCHSQALHMKVVRKLELPSSSLNKA